MRRKPIAILVTLPVIVQNSIAKATYKESATKNPKLHIHMGNSILAI
jgi:hypothetical protein